MTVRSEVAWQDHYDSGLNALREGDLIEAEAHFGLAITAGADAWEPYYGRAWCLVTDRDLRRDAGNLATADRELGRALDEFGAGTDAQALRGQVRLREKRYEEATECFLRALARSSQRDMVESGLAKALSAHLTTLEKARDASAGIDSCERLEKLIAVVSLPDRLADDLLAEVLACRGYLLRKVRRDEDANSAFRRLRELAPRHPRVPDDLPVLSEGRGRAVTVGGVAEPTFDMVAGIGEESSFNGRLKQIFDLYFAEPDVERLRSRLSGYGQTAMRSILLFGPSGCGKTYMVRAFQGEYQRRHRRQLPLFRLRLNEVLNKYVGEDTKYLSGVIDKVIAAQPSILFGDEIDTLAMTRENGQDWRVQLTGHFLQEVDRLREEDVAMIFFGCTNRIWAVDLALLRRFDRLQPVELPNGTIREQIFEVHLNSLNAQVRPSDVDLAELALRSKGLTPGDIQKVIGVAVDSTLAGDPGGREQPPLTYETLLRSLEEYRQPMHVREWVRQSVEALRKIGQDEMATEVQRMYGPYITGLPSSEPHPARPSSWRPIPFDAVVENPELDLSLMRKLRRQ